MSEEFYRKEIAYGPQPWRQYGSFSDDIGPCREGSTTCIGDRRYYCRNGRWRPTSQYCPSDNTPTWPPYGYGLQPWPPYGSFPGDIGPCQQEGSTTCVGDMRYYCRNGRWRPTSQYCPSDIYPYDYLS